MGVKHIQPHELASLLKDEEFTKKQKLAIIDVRDTDFEGGHIKNAVNIPEENFQDDEDTDSIVERFRHHDMVVFHCMKSQVRGPFCANRFSNRLDLLEDTERKPTVYLLYGGFENFVKLYSKDQDVCVDVNESYWNRY